MFICRLFHQDQPFEQVDARLLASGEISIGRDPGADWPLLDRDGTLSRIHCRLAVDEEGRLTLCDTSTNGTFLDDGERAPRDVPVPLGDRAALRLGTLSIFVERAAETPLAADGTQTMVHVPLSSAAATLPHDWTDSEPAPAVPRPAHRDASLLESFCQGAGLDVSALSCEDPVELMERLGEIYRVAVLGLSALIAERTRLKGEHQLQRTTIGAADNNPFKWTGTRRLGQDLLCKREGGFLSGADAVRASFEDLSCHLAGVAEGANASIAAVLDALSPESIDAEAAAEGFSLRGRAAVARDVHARRHGRLAGGGTEGSAAAAFRAAYGAASEQKPD